MYPISAAAFPVICFDSLISDCRRPKGAIYPSAGYTAVQLSIKTGELSYQSFSLSTEANHTTSSPANDTLLNGYTIRLVKVLPYPNIDMPQPVAYSVVLEVTQ